MKKRMFSILCFVSMAAFLYAQEAPAGAAQGQPAAAPPAQQSMLPFPMGEPVKIGMGTLSLDGRILTGFRSQTTYNDGEAGNTSLEAINAEWEENRLELNFDYKLANYGAFVMLQARNFGGNNYGTLNPRFALVYANFFKDKFKVSIGKLYDDIYQIQGSKIWKTEGEGGGFRFTDEDRFSARFEIKPIAGLNVGAQLFFVDNAISAGGSEATKDLWKTEALKEIGIGAMYTSNLFNVQAGVRFDSKVDPMDRNEAKTYLPDYYGDGNMMGTAAATSKGPKYKHMADVGSLDTSTSPPSPTWVPKDYDAGTWAFLGFKLNAVKNLTVTAHGALYNLGAFDKFGYGKFAEFVKYDNLVPNLGIGLTSYQEFYGSDVMKDGITNTPFIRVIPVVTYKPIRTLELKLEGGIGFAADVLDSYWEIKPELKYSINPYVDVCYVKLFYKAVQQDFVLETIKPSIKHTVGLGIDIIF